MLNTISDTKNSTNTLADAAPSAPKKNWSPLAAVLIVVVCFLVAQILGYFIVDLYPILKNWTNAQANNWVNNSVMAQFIYVLVSEGLTLFILWLFIRKRASFKSLGLSKVKWIDLAYFAGGVIGYFVLYLAAVVLASILTHINTSQQQDIGFNNVSGTSAMIMTFISLVILPPIVEEITFRGFLYGRLRQKFIPILAALFTSVLFAVPHLLESDSGQGLLWIAGLDTFVLSLVLCYLREKTGRVWAGMGVHAAKNGVAFIYLFIVHVH